MGSLGSVLEPERSGSKGPDLRVEVDVPRAALGHAHGVALEVSDTLVGDDGRSHARVPSPHDPPGEVRLHLPASFPDGGVLKLRGQGARGDASRAGDLLVRVRLTDDAYAPPIGGRSGAAGANVAWVVAVLGFGVAVAAAMWLAN